MCKNIKEDDGHYNDDGLSVWYSKEYKVQRGPIKEELMPIALHSTRIPDSFVTKDRNKSIKKMLTYGK